MANFLWPSSSLSLRAWLSLIFCFAAFFPYPKGRTVAYYLGGVILPFLKGRIITNFVMAVSSLSLRAGLSQIF